MVSKRFFNAALCIVSLSVIGKVISVIIAAGKPTPNNALLPILSQSQVMALSASAEVAFLWLVVYVAHKLFWKIYAIYVMSVVFLGYHIILLSLRRPHTCGCFGWFTDSRINEALDWLAIPLVLFLLVGSLILTIKEYRDAVAKKAN